MAMRPRHRAGRADRPGFGGSPSERKRRSIGSPTARGLTAASESCPTRPHPVGPLLRQSWPGRLPIATRRAKACATSAPISRGIDWLVETRGVALERTEQLGHDSTLIGWPWVEGTHSWIEPTAWAVLALKSAGLSQHPRTREAIRLLIDRLLPDGGCNFGNTVVLGQQLLPHLQSSGICLLALAGERVDDPRIEPHLRISRARNQSPNRHRIALLQLARAGCARPAVRHGQSPAGSRGRAEPGSRSQRSEVVAVGLGRHGRQPSADHSHPGAVAMTPNPKPPKPRRQSRQLAAEPHRRCAVDR